MQIGVHRYEVDHQTLGFVGVGRSIRRATEYPKNHGGGALDKPGLHRGRGPTGKTVGVDPSTMVRTPS
jgi:hypothetical protein